MVCPACGHVDVPVEQRALVLLAGVSTALPTGCLMSGRGPPGLGSWRTLRRRRGRVEARGRKKEAYGAAGDRGPGADAEVLVANACVASANASDCAADDGAAFFGANACDGASADVLCANALDGDASADGASADVLCANALNGEASADGASADVLCANALDGDASADVLGADAEVGANAHVVGASACDCAADDGAAFLGANAVDGASADDLCASALDDANASDDAGSLGANAFDGAADVGASSLGANAFHGANASNGGCASVLLAHAGVSTALQIEWDSRRQTHYGSDRQLLMQCSYAHFALFSPSRWALQKQQKEPVGLSLILKIILFTTSKYQAVTLEVLCGIFAKRHSMPVTETKKQCRQLQERGIIAITGAGEEHFVRLLAPGNLISRVFQ